MSEEEDAVIGEKRKRRPEKNPKKKIAKVAERIADAFRKKQSDMRKAREQSDREQEINTTTHTAKAVSDASNRSIMVDEQDNWIYATPEDIANPVGGYVIQLVNNSWQRGATMDPFVLNPVVAERFSEWCDYVKRLETHLKLKGDASQWQRALYVASALGPTISGLVNRKKWISKLPIEGCQHYDLVMEKLKEYFRQFANPASAHENLIHAAQGQHESIMDFYERLLRMAEVCGIAEKNPLIKNTLIEGLRDNVLKELVSCQPFTIPAILSTGLAREGRAHQQKTKTQPAPKLVMAVSDSPSNSGQTAASSRIKKPPRRTGDQAQKPASTSGAPQQKPRAGTSGGMGRQASSGESSNPLCKACGYDHTPGPCFALAKTCYNCNKVGHLSRVCPLKAKSSINEVNTQSSEKPKD